jgi:hypothetical protein
MIDPLANLDQGISYFCRSIDCMVEGERSIRLLFLGKCTHYITMMQCSYPLEVEAQLTKTVLPYFHNTCLLCYNTVPACLAINAIQTLAYIVFCMW